MRKISEKVKFFIELLKANKLIRLITGIVLASICLKLSEFSDFWFYPAILFALYPIWLTFWMVIYAWVVNPIRENKPKSWFATVLIPKLDKFVDW
jgi:hypothetical protein